ncbi:MAG: YhdP family protein [Betaproteobacteria bacterium]
MVRRLGRWVRWAALVALLVLAVGVTAMRTLVLPNVDRFREPIARAIGDSLGQRVTLGRIGGGWTDFRPWVTVRDVVVYDDAGTPAFHIDRVHALVGWGSLLRARFQFRKLAIERPDLLVRRDRGGIITVGGVRVVAGDEHGRFAEWIWEQAEIVITGARIVWVDDTRSGEPLELRDVTLQLRNRGRNHAFQLTARPAQQVGTRIDLRADFRRGTAPGPERWRGRAYLHAPYMNLAAVRTWVALPVRFDSGAGEVEAWADFADARVRSATVDLRVAGSVAHIDGVIEALDLPRLQGRFTWAATAEGFEAAARRVSLGVADGDVLPPADVVIRRRRATGSQPGRIQVESNRLDIAPLLYLADHLPLDPAFRKALAMHRPDGRLENFSFWIEPGGAAPARYALSTRFVDVRVDPVGHLPGGRNLSGMVTADQKGGSFRIDARELSFDAPEVFANAIVLTSLQAQADWSMEGTDVVVHLRQAGFANPDLEGTVSGSLRHAPDGANRIDLIGRLARGSPQAVWRYVPRIAGEHTRDWLRTSLRDGRITRAEVRLQGDLREFPFDRGQGVFEVILGVEDGVLAFAPGWPAVEDIDGTVAFRGRGMDVQAQGRILGARVTRSAVTVADLGADDAAVGIVGEAEGPTAEFLRYLDESPVGRLVGGWVQGVRAMGDGALRLTLRVPIHHPEGTTVSGSYAFGGNRIERLAMLPVLSRVQGILQFSEKGARVANASAEMLGGPFRFNVTAPGGGTVRVDARGRLSPAAVPESAPHRLLALARGEVEWRAQALVKGDRVDLSVDSDLKGLALDLPAPLGKATSEVAPVRLQVLTQTRDGESTVSFNAPGRASAAAALVPQGEGLQLRRGSVNFGGSARLPDSPRLAVEGHFPRIVLDEWRKLLERWRAGEVPAVQPAPAPAAPLLPVSVDLSFDRVEAFGREFQEGSISLQRRRDDWEGRIAAREIAGAFAWTSQGKGRLSAQLERLYLPDADPAGAPATSAPVAGGDLPEIDVTAANFHLGARDLGTLTLQAVPSGTAWTLRRLDLRSPDGDMSFKGGWDFERGRPRSKMELLLEARDIGRMLLRLGRPASVAGGTARLSGQVEWEGSPLRPDAATLSGGLSFEARQGRFVQMDPGLGKLLGILSLQALPRRVTLDFRDVFSQGFAFDEIRATSTISQGILRTADCQMTGPSARVSIKGELDIVRETQNLDVRIVPSVTDSLAIGTAVVNPLLGLVALVVGKALNNPIDQAVAFGYHVTGTWADPNVAKAPWVAAPAERSGRR